MKSKKEENPALIYELLDLAILPAALLICAKAAGIALLNSLLQLDWGIQSIANAVFSVRVVYANASEAVLVTNYTNLFMFVMVLAGAIVVTSKSLLFHNRKASPYFVLKLARYDLLHLLKNSLHIYKETFVWSVFLILTTVYVCISALNGQTQGWVAGISAMFTLTFLWVIVQNIEEEIMFHNYKS